MKLRLIYNIEFKHDTDDLKGELGAACVWAVSIFESDINSALNSWGQQYGVSVTVRSELEHDKKSDTEPGNE